METIGRERWRIWAWLAVLRNNSVQPSASVSHSKNPLCGGVLEHSPLSSPVKSCAILTQAVLVKPRLPKLAEQEIETQCDLPICPRFGDVSRNRIAIV